MHAPGLQGTGPWKHSQSGRDAAFHRHPQSLRSAKVQLLASDWEHVRQGYQTLFSGSMATVGAVVESVASDVSGWTPQYVQLNGVFCDLKTAFY